MPEVVSILNSSDKSPCFLSLTHTHCHSHTQAHSCNTVAFLSLVLCRHKKKKRKKIGLRNGFLSNRLSSCFSGVISEMTFFSCKSPPGVHSPFTYKSKRKKMYAEVVRDMPSWSLQKRGTPPLVFLHAVSLLNFLNMFYFFVVLFFFFCFVLLYAFANFCEVVRRVILYQDLCYSLFGLLYFTKLIVPSNV